MKLTKNSNKFISFLLTGLFALTFVLPTLQGPMGVKFDGISVALINLFTIKFVTSFSDYIAYLFVALTNVWIVVLLFWSFRSELKITPTVLLSVLSITSAISWFFRMEDGNVLLIGYWLWLLTIILIAIFNLYKAFTKPSII